MPLSGHKKADHEPKQGRFSAAAGSNQNCSGSGSDREVSRVQGFDLTKALGDAAEIQHGGPDVNAGHSRSCFKS